jgi:hypothetical protein
MQIDYFFPLLWGILLLLQILVTILYLPMLYRFWQLWKHFKQYETPFALIGIPISLLTWNYSMFVLFNTFVSYHFLINNFYFLLIGVAAAIYLVIGAFIARRRDIAYSRFVDKLLWTKYKEKKISRIDYIRGRYPDDVLLATSKHPRASWFPKRTLIGYILTGITGTLLILLLTDPSVWLLLTPPYVILPYIIFFLAITIFTTGLLILAEKWSYAGLATIVLATLTVIAIIHLPHLIIFHISILSTGILSGFITPSKLVVKPTTPIETPPELAAIVHLKPPYTTEHITAYIGGVIILVGGILTVIGDILNFLLMSVFWPLFATFFGIPLDLYLTINMLLVTGIAVTGILAIIAGLLILRKHWRKGGLLALICGTLTLLTIGGIVTLIGAIITLVKHPKTETPNQTQHQD